MAAFIVIAGPLAHDGKEYADGERVDLDGAAAAPLLEVGVVEAAPTKGKAKAEE